jgi:putative ABC transport system ATP-binding protein
MFRNPFRRKNGDQPTDVAAYDHGNEQLIELRNVSKDYETAAGVFTALRDVDLDVDRGQFVAVVGKSGSGKSTLINMLTGIDRPTDGQVLVGDTAVQALKEGDIAVWRGKNVGIIFQFFQLLPTLTVLENVMLPMDFCNVIPNRERRDRAMHLLEQVEMTEHADKLPTAVSGGQQQRVAIARALANDPPIIVADEPTGNLDSTTADSVFVLFENLVADGKTILMVTHDSDLADRVMRKVTLADGVLVSDEWLRDVHDDATRANLSNSVAEQGPDEESSADDMATDATPANEPTGDEKSDIIVTNEEADVTSEENNV